MCMFQSGMQRKTESSKAVLSRWKKKEEQDLMGNIGKRLLVCLSSESFLERQPGKQTLFNPLQSFPKLLFWELWACVPYIWAEWGKEIVSGWCQDGNTSSHHLVRSLKSSILSSTSFPMDKTVRGVVSAAAEQSRHKASMVARGDGKFGPWGWPQDPSKTKKCGKEVHPGSAVFNKRHLCQTRHRRDLRHDNADVCQMVHLK